MFRSVVSLSKVQVPPLWAVYLGRGVQWWQLIPTYSPLPTDKLPEKEELKFSRLCCDKLPSLYPMDRLQINSVLPAGLSKKKHEKKTPLSEKKKHNFSNKKKALFNIISFLKRVFCLPFLHKISPFNMFKTINYLFLFFNISKTSYFTKQQTPLMIIVSHNFKEMIFFIRID